MSSAVEWARQRAAGNEAQDKRVGVRLGRALWVLNNTLASTQMEKEINWKTM